MFPPHVGCIPSGNGSELINLDFVGLVDRLGIRSKYTFVDSPKRTVLVERRIAAAHDVAMVFCLDAPRVFGHAKLPQNGASPGGGV